MIAAGIAMLIGLVALVAQHVYWSGRDRRTIATCDALLDETRANVRQAKAQAADWRESARRRGEDRHLRVAQVRDLGNLLTVERAYSAACDRQLRALANIVEGKALVPTLAPDDVVVEFPKRGRV